MDLTWAEVQWSRFRFWWAAWVMTHDRFVRDRFLDQVRLTRDITRQLEAATDELLAQTHVVQQRDAELQSAREALQSLTKTVEDLRLIRGDVRSSEAGDLLMSRAQFDKVMQENAMLRLKATGIL